MKTLRLVILFASLAMLSYCGEKRTVNETKAIDDAPGVGMAEDSANQKLDSTMKARDTTRQ